MLRLHDTALGKVVDIEAREPGRFSMYVCGPTVYDVPHLGHGRNVLVYDILRRYLEWRGDVVHHVSNITDIDDNIIKRAARDGRTSEEVAVEFERSWWDALDKLGVLPPHDAPHATAYVDGMIDLVTRLIEADHAYPTSDGVYLDVSTVEGYGLLARQPLESLRVGARIDVDDEKRSPLDFALWKLAKPGEPSWPSPWGEGRPGWHTECVVMSLDLLGEGFDLHTGGLDLMFPHHENERAQAVALGRQFARHWMHHAFVEVAGEKMSKSLNNFTSLTDLLGSTDPRAYRLLVLQSHYRKPLDVTRAATTDAEGALATLDAFGRRANELADVAPDDAALANFRERMEDDLDTPSVVAELADLRRRANTLIDAGDAAGAAPLAGAFREIVGALGLAVAAEADELDVATADLMARRDEARVAKDFATADAIRAELEAAGWIVEDTPTGTRVHR
ncbi:MAG: cysteine--tRNA ligase [Actinomycetota bacterium]|nr:cysteine--tRNA ligase [Actinomycetota bacterium]